MLLGLLVGGTGRRRVNSVITETDLRWYSAQPTSHAPKLKLRQPFCSKLERPVDSPWIRSSLFCPTYIIIYLHTHSGHPRTPVGLMSQRYILRNHTHFIHRTFHVPWTQYAIHRMLVHNMLNMGCLYKIRHTWNVGTQCAIHWMHIIYPNMRTISHNMQTIHHGMYTIHININTLTTCSLPRIYPSTGINNDNLCTDLSTSTSGVPRYSWIFSPTL